jgi:hypothetical protein
MADEWARPPPAVSGVPCGLGDEKVKILGTPRTIPSMGIERLPTHVALIFPAVLVVGHGALDPLPCHFNL